MTSIADRKYLSNYLSKYLQCSLNPQIWKYFSMEISNENTVRRTGFIKWRRRSAEIGERRGLWNSIDLRALPGLCHPCRRRCTQSQDQGFGIWDVQSISSNFVRRKILEIPKKSHPRIVASLPPPLLRRARISAAHMTYLLLSVIVAPRDLKMQLFCDNFLYDWIFIGDCSWFLFNVYVPGTVSVSIRPPQWFSIFPIMEEAAPLRYLCPQFWKPRPLIVQIIMSMCAVKGDSNLSKFTRNRGRSQYTYVLSG